MGFTLTWGVLAIVVAEQLRVGTRRVALQVVGNDLVLLCKARR